MIKEFGNKVAFDLFHYGKTKKLDIVPKAVRAPTIVPQKSA